MGVSLTRRNFLKVAGASAAASAMVGTLASCKKEEGNLANGTADKSELGEEFT